MYYRLVPSEFDVEWDQVVRRITFVLTSKGTYCLQDMTDPRNHPKRFLKQALDPVNKRKFDTYTVFHYKPIPGVPTAPVVTRGGPEMYTDTKRRRYVMDDQGRVLSLIHI